MASISNPFIISGNIPEPYFCDRKKETERLITTLTGGQNLCLISPRRMGKSKLVKHLFNQSEIEQNYYCFYIDLLHTSSLRDFVFAFGHSVFDTLNLRSQKFAMDFLSFVRSLKASLSFDPISGQPEFGLTVGDNVKPEYTFEKIFAYLEQADRPCIVCFDEFQQITNYQENNVEALLRSYVQHLSNTHFIFSGSERHILYAMFSEKSRPFYKSTSFMELDAISLDAYSEFVQSWFKHYDKIIDNGIINLYYNFAEGNTYNMQLISHELFSVTDKETLIDRLLLKEVIDNVVESERMGYERILSRLSERQQALLFAIAHEGRVEKIMSGDFIRKYRLSSASSVQNAIKHLLSFDLVSVEGKQYLVQDVFLRQYLIKISEYFE